jgi:hypothetical protein
VRQGKKRLVEDWKLGIGTPSGEPQALSTTKAWKLARSEWTRHYVAQQIQAIQHQWDDQRAALEEEFRSLTARVLVATAVAA